MWNFNFINHLLHEVKSLHHFPFLYRSASTLNSLDGLTQPLILNSKIIGFCTYRSRFCFWVTFLTVFKCRYPCSSRFFFTLIFFPLNDCQCQFFPLITAYNYTYKRLNLFIPFYPFTIWTVITTHMYCIFRKKS